MVTSRLAEHHHTRVEVPSSVVPTPIRMLQGLRLYSSYFRNQAYLEIGWGEHSEVHPTPIHQVPLWCHRFGFLLDSDADVPDGRL